MTNIKEALGPNKLSLWGGKNYKSENYKGKVLTYLSDTEVHFNFAPIAP